MQMNNRGLPLDSLKIKWSKTTPKISLFSPSGDLKVPLDQSQVATPVAKQVEETELHVACQQPHPGLPPRET